MRNHSQMELMLEGYGLTTAQILYRYPDHPHLLQTFIWQDYDLAPKFPVLGRFIEAHNRAGVPLYLYYPPGGREPEVLPQVLTPGLLEAL